LRRARDGVGASGRKGAEHRLIAFINLLPLFADSRGLKELGECFQLYSTFYLNLADLMNQFLHCHELHYLSFDKQKTLANQQERLQFFEYATRAARMLRRLQFIEFGGYCFRRFTF
jgi:hypothetical protein